MEVLPDRVADSVLDEVHRTRQRAVFGPWRPRPMSRATLAAAAVVAVVARSAFFMIQRGQPAVIGPAPTASPSARPSQPAVVVPTATPPTERRGGTVAGRPEPELTWTKVDLDRRSPRGRLAWRSIRAGRQGLRCRLHIHRRHRPGKSCKLAIADPGYVDLLRGAFASWQDSAVGWLNPEDGPDIREASPR